MPAVLVPNNTRRAHIKSAPLANFAFNNEQENVRKSELGKVVKRKSQYAVVDRAENKENERTEQK